MFTTNKWYDVGEEETTRFRLLHQFRENVLEEKQPVVCFQRPGLSLQTIGSQSNVPSSVQTFSVCPPVYTRPLLTWQLPNIVLDAVSVSAEL